MHISYQPLWNTLKERGDVYKRQPLHRPDDCHPDPPPDRDGRTGVADIPQTGAGRAAAGRYVLHLSLIHILAVLISSVAFNLAISEKENQYPKATALLSSTPYTKGKVIVSKYALYFIIYVICCIAYLLEMQFVPELKLDNFAQTAALVFLIQAFGMGIFLPIQYKFGYEKTKFVCFLLFLSPVIIDITKRISFPSKLVSLMQSNSVIAAAILCGCGILIWLVSFAISNKIFAKKDLISKKID